MNQRIWSITECEEADIERLSQEAGVSRLVARLLVNRGIVEPQEARAFMNPRLEDLHDPYLLPDMEAGVKRVAKALRDNEKILVHGDYDVDGITSAALLIRVLKALKADVVYRVPHRKKEGYDIKPWTAEEAKEEGVTLIITSDCGVTACETVGRAVELGIDTVVTDHHEPGPVLPPALAVINPMREDSQYPFKRLAGVGVAFKFAQALVCELGLNESRFQQKFLDLVALGTVSDVVPLVGENRVFVKYGLEMIAKTGKIGLQTLLRRCKLQGRPLNSYYLGYVIGPRINAVGRMDDSAIALQLFLTGDETEAEQLSDVLEKHNTERRAEQARIFEQAVEIAAQYDLEKKRVLVLASPGWNSGVVGIVASKIVDLYGRPAILLSVDEESRTCAGSARSIESFNLIEALDACRDVLDRCGGHAFAAGISLQLDKLSEFDAKINELAADLLPVEELVPRVEVDAQIDPDELTDDVVAELASLEPFGHGNPEPVFVSSQVEVVSKKRVGDGSHLKLQMRSRERKLKDCIAFGFGELEDAVQVGKGLDLCYTVRLNTFNGVESVQMVARDVRT